MEQLEPKMEQLSKQILKFWIKHYHRYAERKAGELLKETELNKGGNPNLSNDTTALPKLKDIGITRDQSSNW